MAPSRLAAPRWVAATDTLQARCEVDGSIEPVDRSATARPIKFRVWLPADWNGRAVQQGGGGMNGSIPDLSGARYPIGGRSPAQLGFATFGSDSGHQMTPGPQDWALNDEAMKNLGYTQLKKTHDAAMVLIERVYGARPRYTYFTGTSQGGREALTVAQRYPADYDGMIANVPIVSFSSLMLAPELIRIQEKPLANWVTRAKVNAIRGEFMRQCDALDGVVDGVINNYMACRAIFDVSQGRPGRHPWLAKRCPDNVDPNPGDTTAAACLTDGQISTLEFVYRRYPFATPLANGVKSFGMWVPNTDPSGSGLIADARFIGQEGAGAGRAHALASRRPRGHGIPDAEPRRESARLRRRRRAQRAPGGDLAGARFDEPGSPDVCRPRRQDDRDDRHERHAGVARRAARLLPVAARHDGPARRRPVRAPVRDSPGRPRADRQRSTGPMARARATTPGRSRATTSDSRIS